MGNLAVYCGVLSPVYYKNYTMQVAEEVSLDEAHGPLLDAWAARMLGVSRESHNVNSRVIWETDECFRQRALRMAVSQWRVFADRDLLLSPRDLSGARERQKSMSEDAIRGEIASCRPFLNVRLEGVNAVGWRRIAAGATVEDIKRGFDALAPWYLGDAPDPCWVTRIGPQQWLADYARAQGRGTEMPREVLDATYYDHNQHTERFGDIAEWRAVKTAARTHFGGVTQWRNVTQEVRARCDLHVVASLEACVLCGDFFAPADRLVPLQFCLPCAGDLHLTGADLPEAEAEYAKKRGITLTCKKVL